jgi:hypothetical protein
MRAASRRRRESENSPHYEPGTSPSQGIKITRRTSFEEAVAQTESERSRQNAMGREQRRAESPNPVPGWDAGDVEGSAPNTTTRRGPASPSENPDRTGASMQRRAMSDLRAETERSRRTRVVPNAAGTTEGPMSGAIPGRVPMNAAKSREIFNPRTPSAPSSAKGRPGAPKPQGSLEDRLRPLNGSSSIAPGPRATAASRSAEARIGAQNPNVTEGSLEEISPEERKAARDAAMSRLAPGERRVTGKGTFSSANMNSVVRGDTSVERGRNNAARALRRTAPGKSLINPKAVPVAKELTMDARKKAASDFERSAVRKAEAVEAGATNVKPAQLASVTPVHPTQVMGTKEYHLARVSEALGHEPEHVASYLRSTGIPLEVGAKGLYDLVHRETKGQEIVTKGSKSKGTLRQEPKRKAVTVVNRGGKTVYEKGTGNGTPALEALKQKITEHVESSTASKRKAGTDVADAMVKAADAAANMPQTLRGAPGIG